MAVTGRAAIWLYLQATGRSVYFERIWKTLADASGSMTKQDVFAEIQATMGSNFSETAFERTWDYMRSKSIIVKKTDQGGNAVARYVLGIDA